MQFCPDKEAKCPENSQMLDVISSTVCVHVLNGSDKCVVCYDFYAFSFCWLFYACHMYMYMHYLIQYCVHVCILYM